MPAFPIVEDFEILEDRIGELENEPQGIENELSADMERMAGARKLLDVALKLAGSVYRTYRKAEDDLRRQYDRAFMKRVYIRNGQLERVEWHDPFAQLVAGASSLKVAQLECRGHYLNLDYVPGRDPYRGSDV